MACMITLNLREPAAKLENLSHPLHKTWCKSLRLLRDMGLDKITNERRKQMDMSRDMQRDITFRMKWHVSESSFCCVDQEHPDQVVYLYPQCSDEKFKAIRAMCLSETSKLSQRISPLLKAPLSAASISRSSSEGLKRIHVRVGSRPLKHLEFLTFHNPERPTFLYHLLERYEPPHMGARAEAVESFSTFYLDSDREEKVLFECIDWTSFSVRETAFADPDMRKAIQFANRDYRPPVLQALGKTEEELTWEENFSVLLETTGAKSIRRRFVAATLVTDDYLGLSKKKRMPCVIL